MSIRNLGAYWCIFSGEQPIITCTTFERAWELLYLTAEEMRHG